MPVLENTANTPEAWSGRASAPSSWEAAGWSEYGQTQRFLAALRHLDVREGETLLDFGSGTGRFAAFLPLGVEYHALDWSSEMLARLAAENPGATLHHELPDDELFDHLVAIGPFNLRDNWSKEQTWEMIHDLFCHARRTLAVSLYRGDDERCLSYSPVEVAEFALHYRGFHDRFVIDAQYLRNDVLLVLRGGFS